MQLVSFNAHELIHYTKKSKGEGQLKGGQMLPPPIWKRPWLFILIVHLIQCHAIKQQD